MSETTNVFWPNVLPIQDGVVPGEEVNQDSDLVEDDNIEEEMK